MPLSVVIRHPMALMETAPVVFVQYLVGMAIVKAIKTYGKGYEQMPVKLKWPNDICKSSLSHYTSESPLINPT